MNALSITRKMDDLGRIVIPMEIRERLGWKEGETLKILTEKDMVCLKRYEIPQASLQKFCAEWVNRNRDSIVSVNVKGNETYVVFKDVRNTIKTAEVTRHPKDNYDINVAICYCAKKCGFTIEGL